MKRSYWILLLFVLVKIIFQFIAVDPVYELHRDEFLHLDLGKHLAWGYSSVPPLTSWISLIILKLGGSFFLVRLTPAIFGALTIVAVWKITEELGGDLFALILASVCMLFSVFLRINLLYQPNSAEYLLWTLFFLFLIRFLKSEKPFWLFSAAVTFAFGFLNKYNIGFLAAGMIPALLLSPHRKILTAKKFWYAMALAILIILPNLVWQFRNGLPVIGHMRELRDTQLVNFARTDFLKSQLLFFTGSLFVIAAAFISFFTFKSFKAYRVFFWTYVFTMAIYTYFRAKGYYSIGLYPVLLAFGSVYLASLLKEGWLRIFRPVAVILPLLFMLSFYKVLVPVLSPEKIIKSEELFKKYGLLRWEDGENHLLPQDFADMLGWKEMASIADGALDSLPDKEYTIIHCDNYGQAGSFNYYSKQKTVQAYSYNADYINWYPLDKEIRNVILIQEASDTDTGRTKERPYFESVSFMGEVKNPYAREKGTRIYLLKGAKINVNEFIRKEIAEIKLRNQN
jgi:hypothetical protein